jgi:Dolichyl-phosphate-mannose-protein mannosyltransferase
VTAGLLVAAGMTAFSIALVVSIAGGFNIDVGPLHFSAHRVLPPLIAGIGAHALAAAIERGRVRRTLEAVYSRIDTHALAIAIVLAAAHAGIGVSFGTYSASAADGAGYVSQAELLAQRRITFNEPLILQAPWPEAAWTFAPLGYRPGPQGDEIVPTYPPGLPLAMVVAATVAGEAGPFLVAPLFGAVCVFATCLLGARLHGRICGVVAAALMTTSPIWLFQIVQPMSDVPAATLWTIALLAATSRATIVAGLASSAAILMRPNLFLLGASVLVVLLYSRKSARQSGPRAHAATLAAFAAAATIGPLLIAAVQWRLYGNPLLSGHGTLSDLFAIGNIPTNVRDYAVRIVVGETPAIAASIVALILLVVMRRRAMPEAPSLAKPFGLLLVVAVPLLVCYLPYGVFPDWSYLRFLMPVFPAAFIAVGALVANASLHIPGSARGPCLVLTLVACCSADVAIARRYAAFDMHRYESRYRTAGRYLAEVLPRDAVIVTSQESASAHYYTRLPILRWDFLADLDAAVQTLIAAGRHPVLLVEDWEEPVLRARFPQSALARLDWNSRALFGTTTRVRVLDPADRDPTPAESSRPTLQIQDRLP